jgi:hypothetical protein
MDEPIEISPRRRIDGITAIMLGVTAVSLLGAAWLRIRRPPENEPPSVGDLAPALRLVDIESSEPLILIGLRGKIVWVVFWSADTPSSRSSLVPVEWAWSQLKARRRFTLAAAAVAADNPARVREVVAESGVTLPVYLASAETHRAYGALQADPPLHVLIDAEGRIAAVARGAGAQTIERITEQAKTLLEALDPAGEPRFASTLAIGAGTRNDSRGAATDRARVGMERPHGFLHDLWVHGQQVCE